MITSSTYVDASVAMILIIVSKVLELEQQI